MYTEFTRTEDLLKEYTTQTEFIFRCPGGLYNNEIRNTISVPMIQWSIDTEDWKYRDVDKIVDHVIGKVQDGDIVLMHEIYGTSAEAVEVIIPKLIEQGYQIVSVSELMKAKGIDLIGGKIYSNAR